jgi:hypothetical protein
MKAPTTGQARIRFINGTVSGWVKPDELEITANWVHCQGDVKGEICLSVPWVSISGIEYATDAEVEKITAQAKAARQATAGK